MSLIPLNDKRSTVGTWTQYGWRFGPIPEPGSERIPVTRHGLGLPSSCEVSYTMAPGALTYICPAYVPNPTNVASKKLPFWIPLTTSQDPTKAAMRSYKPTYRPTIGDEGIPSPDLGAVQLKYPTTLAVEWVDFLEPGQSMWLSVFGYDYYGFPLQEMVQLSHINPGGQINETLMQKAFYGVTAAYLNQIPDDLNWTDFAIDITSTYIYGFPYLILDRGAESQPGVGQMLQIADSLGNTQADYTIESGSSGSGVTAADGRGTFFLTEPDTPSWINVKYQVFSASPELARMENEANGGNPGGVQFATDAQFCTYGLSEIYGPTPTYWGYVIDGPA